MLPTMDTGGCTPDGAVPVVSPSTAGEVSLVNMALLLASRQMQRSGTTDLEPLPLRPSLSGARQLMARSGTGDLDLRRLSLSPSLNGALVPPSPRSSRVAWSNNQQVIIIPSLLASASSLGSPTGDDRPSPTGADGVSPPVGLALTARLISLRIPPTSCLVSCKVAPLSLTTQSSCGSSSCPSPSHKDGERPDAKAQLSTSMSSRQLLGSVSFSHGLSSLKRLAVGDDFDIEDRWLTSSMSVRTSALQGAGQEGGSVVPDGAHAQYQRMNSVMVSESTSRGFRTLLWYYLQTFLYSVVVAAPVVPLVYCLSLVDWHQVNPNADVAKNEPAYFPNHTAIQWALFMQCVFSLALYAVVLYCASMRTFRVPQPLMITTAAVIAVALVVVSLFWHYDVRIWYYYLDLLLIAVVFLIVSCMVGWLVAGPEATLKQKIDEVLFVALLEMLVASATLVYTTFLMPLFFTLTSAWLQLLWLCVVHPLYFEVTTAAVVRKALHRQVALGRTDIVNFLPIVHAMVHLVGIGISLMASIEPVHIMLLSVLLYNIGKLTWRSTILWRDLFIERVTRWDWSFNYEPEARLALCQIISLSVLTELILENSAIISAPFMLWCMYKEPIFMTVVPNTYFYNEGTYPVASLFVMVAIMFGFTWIGDLGFFALNYYTGQHLPIIHTWRKIKQGKWAYLGFLTYALTTMGVMFSFSMMLILPRAAYCHSDNYCDCSLPAYKAVCKGEFISLLVDYLI